VNTVTAIAGDGGVRRRPAPEHATAQKSEPEDVTDVIADEVRRVDAARERFVCGCDQRANEFSLADGPARQHGSGIINNRADDEQKQWQSRRQQHANDSRRPHPSPQRPIVGGEVIIPIKAAQDENDREQDGDEMPDEPPASETADQVAGQRHQKLFHVGMVWKTGEKAIGFGVNEVFSFQFQVFRKATFAVH
jgi:hypothetical protein